MEGPYFPRTFGHLPEQRSVAPVQVQMFVAGTFTEPEEVVGADPLRTPDALNPRRSLVAEQSPGRAACGIGGVQIQPCLLSILNLKENISGVGTPADVDEKHLLICVLCIVDAYPAAGGQIDDEQPDRGIRVTGFRIVDDLEALVIRNVINDGESRNSAFVELEKRDARRVGTPPVTAEDAPAIDLFLINPVELSVEKICSAVGRQPVLASIRHAHDVEIVVADERDLRSVRTERRFLFRSGCGGQLREFRVAKGVEKDVVRDGQKNYVVLSVQRQLPASRQPRGLILTGLRGLAKRRAEKLLIKEKLLRAGPHVDEQKVDDFAFRIGFRPE